MADHLPTSSLEGTSLKSRSLQNIHTAGCSNDKVLRKKWQEQYVNLLQQSDGEADDVMI